MSTCDDCGFDDAQWNPADAGSTLRVVHIWFEWLAEGATPEVAAALAPDAATVAGINRSPARYDDAMVELHTALHAINHAGRIRHRDTRSQQGTIVQVNSSRGGVPKRPVDGPAQVEWSGLTTDRQDDRDNHGRPWQALCLWSTEVIEALVAEGHPIGPGYAGENLTISGLDWSTISPGQRLRVGTVLLETTPYSIPCSKNAGWFAGGDFRRMTHDLHPGWSRIYARVLEPGTVAANDPVVVLP